MVSIVMVWVFW